ARRQNLDVVPIVIDDTRDDFAGGRNPKDHQRLALDSNAVVRIERVEVAVNAGPHGKLRPKPGRDDRVPGKIQPGIVRLAGNIEGAFGTIPEVQTKTGRHHQRGQLVPQRKLHGGAELKLVGAKSLVAAVVADQRVRHLDLLEQLNLVHQGLVG